jgi:acetyl-CoA carboxylase biotin carboxyl carrier protein
MKLTHEDVQEIVRLLDASFYDELHLETDKFKLTLQRVGAERGGWTQEMQTLAKPKLKAGSDGGDRKETAAKPASAADAKRDGGDATLAVLPPMTGTFYRAPKPGAAPYVEVGTAVEADTVVGIVETMKLMNPVCAGAAGVVLEICAGDGELVAAERILMRLRPEAA